MYALSTVAICLIQEQPVSRQVSTKERGYRGILLKRRIEALFVFFFAVSISSFLGRSFAAIYLQEVSELPLSTIGSLGSALAIRAVILSPILGLISAKQGVLWALIAAEAMLFAGHSIFLGFSGVLPAALAYFLWGSSTPITSLSQAIIGKELEGESVGRGFALQGIVMSLATIVVPYATRLLYTARPELPFWSMLVILPLLMIVTIIPKRHGVD